MSDEQRALLTEYDEWRALKENEAPDLSAEAFLVERENRLNRARISGALALLTPPVSPDVLDSVRDILTARP